MSLLKEVKISILSISNLEKMRMFTEGAILPFLKYRNKYTDFTYDGELILTNSSKEQEFIEIFPSLK